MSCAASIPMGLHRVATVRLRASQRPLGPSDASRRSPAVALPPFFASLLHVFAYFTSENSHGTRQNH